MRRVCCICACITGLFGVLTAYRIGSIPGGFLRYCYSQRLSAEKSESTSNKSFTGLIFRSQVLGYYS